MKKEALIKHIFNTFQNGTVLFLGRVTHFSDREIREHTEVQGMKYINKYEDSDPVLLVLSRRLTSVEEQISEMLYSRGVPDVTLEAFEQYMSAHIKPDTLLMSLKLSGDQVRLKRLLGNEAFSNVLFLKLLRMYEWGEEGVHENDANRDVTISFVKRFFRPEGFRDSAMVYAPTTLMIIAKESSDPAVLEAILSMPNHEVKVSRYEQKRPKNLREMVAFNPHISKNSLQRLLSYASPDIDYFLASNAAAEQDALAQIYARADRQTKQMMTQHPRLPDALFEALLQEKASEIVQSLLVFQPFDEKRLAQVWASPEIAYLGANRGIGAYAQRLLALENTVLDRALAANPSVDRATLEQLAARYGERIAVPLASNPAISPEMAAQLYSGGERSVLEALSANPATPVKILNALCELEERALNRQLASNPSVEIAWLRQFQLDTSLIRILAENPTYGEHIGHL